MSDDEEIKTYELLLRKTLELMSLYKKNAIKQPSSLIGNLGEFIILKELNKEIKSHKIIYQGGTFPSYDIAIDNVKIQVKTNVHKPHKYFDFESSPTIARSIIEEKKVDIIALVILYLNEDYSKMTKTNIYIFDQNDFKYFSHEGCWSGRSKSDYTIYNILDVFETPPYRKKQLIYFYNNQKYKNLFKNSKNKWHKIRKLLR